LRIFNFVRILVPREQQLLLPYPTLYYNANGRNLTLIDVLEEDTVGSTPADAYNTIIIYCEKACKFRHKNVWLAIVVVDGGIIAYEVVYPYTFPKYTR
jgi:hypothetical protein